MADGAAAIGSEKEAQAFAEMLQKLLLDHKLEMTDLEFETMEKESPIERHFIDYSRYPDIKIRKTRVLWIEQLARIVAESHFCRILIHPRSSRITLVGRHEDVTVAEYMFVTLQRSLDHISEKAAYYHKLECHRNRVAVGYGFRESFTDSFLQRLRDRFLAMRKTVEPMGLMRMRKSDKAVEDFIEENFKKTASALSTNTKFHPEGIRRGRAAADKINLKGQAIETQGAGKKELS